MRFDRLSQAVVAASLVALLSSCNSTSSGGLFSGVSAPEKPAAVDAVSGAPVMEGACPAVALRDGTAVHQVYAGKGAGQDPEKLTLQASLADATRACTMNGQVMTVTVAAQGRLVLGPAGKTGKVVLPIRVAVTDGQTTLYSELTKFEAEIPANGAATQFLFTRNDVTIPGGAGKFAKVFIGFDPGPYNTK